MVEFDALQVSDYDETRILWENTPELNFKPEFDSRERIGQYIERNPGLSSVARVDGKVIGVVLCGYDGRRGSIYHLAVDKSHRAQGVAKKLVERSLDQLRAIGIDTVFLMVSTSNSHAVMFWEGMGWEPMPNVRYYLKSIK